MFRYIYFLFFSPMRSLALTSIAIIAISSFSAAFAVDEPTTPVPAPTPVTEVAPPVLLAAPSVTASAGSSLGEYKSVSCNSNSAFAINNCDQCFD